MGFWDKLFGRKEDKVSQQADVRDRTQDMSGTEPEPNAGLQEIIDVFLAMAERALEKGDHAQAFQTYKDILNMKPDEVTAQYNLGSMYARGLGVEQDFSEAAYWFHRAELNGSEQAGKLVQKCIMDHIFRDIEDASPQTLYNGMVRILSRIDPGADIPAETNRKLYALAQLCFNKQDYQSAGKLFRAAAEFGYDGLSQNWLGVLYNNGAGVRKNDLAALYWFDKAVENGAAEAALQDRDGILNAYRTNFSGDAFSREIMELSEWCAAGSEDVPKDPEKAEYWRKIAENG